MTTANIVSWNIEKFGFKKLYNEPFSQIDPKLFYGVLTQFIVDQKADLIGIMEINAMYGKEIVDKMIIELNNISSSVTWKGRYSAQQMGGTCEQYVYLFQDRDDLKECNTTLPDSLFLLNMFDTDMLTRNVTKDATRTTQITQALLSDGYLSKASFIENRVTVLGYTSFANNQLGDNLKALTPSTAELNALKQIFANLGYARYPLVDSRSPCILSMLMGKPVEIPFLVVLYHALGTKDFNRVYGINNIALNDLLVNWTNNGNTLLMGDFNILRYDMLCAKWGIQDGTFKQLTPRVYQRIFAPIIGTPLNLTRLLDITTMTTITHDEVAPNAPMADCLASPYDNFYFGSNKKPMQAFNIASKGVVNLLTTLQNNALSLTDFQQKVLDYVLAMGASSYAKDKLIPRLKDKRAKKGKPYDLAKKAYDDFKNGNPDMSLPFNQQRDATLQANMAKNFSKADNLDKSIANAQYIQTWFDNLANGLRGPIDIAIAKFFYAYISDHLPIQVNLSA